MSAREGVLFLEPDRPIEHAWLVLHGEIVDVTLQGYSPGNYVDTGVGYGQREIAQLLVSRDYGGFVDEQRVTELRLKLLRRTGGQHVAP